MQQFREQLCRPRDFDAFDPVAGLGCRQRVAEWANPADALGAQIRTPDVVPEESLRVRTPLTFKTKQIFHLGQDGKQLEQFFLDIPLNKD
jgi:hypothetical protein